MINQKNFVWFFLAAIAIYYVLKSSKTVEKLTMTAPVGKTVTEQSMEDYVQKMIKKNSIFCDGKTCSLQNVQVPIKVAQMSVQYPQYTQSLQHKMYTAEGTIIYQNIFDAMSAKVIEKIGNPNAYNDTAYVPGKEWNGRPIIQFGYKANPDNNGMLVHPPAGTEVIWVRILNERWVVVKAQLKNGGQTIGRFAGGYRNLNNYTPDGTMGNDGFHNLHVWMPIPLPKSNVGDVVLTSSAVDSDFWCSGVAFSKNPWKHAMNSAVAYHWNLNTPGVPSDGINNDASKTGIAWETHNWNNDQLMRIQNNNPTPVFYVPVVPNNKDKLLYAIEHNNNWLGTGHVSISVNDQPIERFRSTYDNPFARHFNSKIYDRYIAARVPFNLIKPTDRFMKVTIHMQPTNHNLYFREMGTHDLFPESFTGVGE